jgi:hypothetical protein
VRWIGVPKQDQKVHPALLSELTSAPPNRPLELWVSVFESDVGPTSVRRTLPGPVQTGPHGGTAVGEPLELRHVWVTNGWQHQALDAAGAEVIDFAERANTFRVRAMPQGLALLTSLDFVQFLELRIPARPMHDESMPLINADDARNFYTGGSNLRTIAGLVDSGVESAHTDLNHIKGFGWDLSGSASGTPWNDACGHGSHVAGTIFGSGYATDDHKGAAPGLGFDGTHRVFNVRIFDTCAPQSVDEAAVIGLMSNPASTGGETTQRPHVINNSWGIDGVFGSAWVGTETECQLYDDNAYSDAQLNVFAAGNGGSLYSIALQASSKNVLTVGNVLDYYNVGYPGNLANGTSHGPTGDGRWKPNVVAPGGWVTSVDASSPTGYTNMSSTSMAAAHVTGVAAQLIDSDPAFIYLPELISAHLMATAHARGNAVITTPAHSTLNNFGVGRVDATRAIWGSGGANTHWSFSLGSTGSTFFDFTVPSGASRLVAVMHYVEPAASAGASQALVNDWDFYLDQPPINPAGNTGEYLAQQSARDNTEIRIVENPPSGTWRWKIWPDSTSTTAYFGVSIYVQTTDSSPYANPTLTESKTYVQPGETVQADYNLATTGGSISAVYLASSSTAGAVLVGSRTYLEDGVVTDLLDNPHNGWDITLGNVDPFFSRDAQWELHWPTEGDKFFGVVLYSENASNSGTVDNFTVVVDGTPPGAVSGLTSTSHTPGVWSNDPDIDYTWVAAIDPTSGGTSSGLDGYGVLTSVGSPATPAPTVVLGTVTTHTSGPHATSTSGYFFNLRAVDRSENWGSSVNTGGYLIDTAKPPKATNLSSSTHVIGTLSCDTTISFDWTASVDGHSGTAGYGVLVNTSPTTPGPTTVTQNTTSYTTTVGPGDWYLHVRAHDVAGNKSNTAHLGPFTIDPDPTYVYCTAKVNSQGCTPTIGSLGAPSYSGGAFEVVATNVLNNKTGLMFWGTQPTSTPFQGGTKCVASPVSRTPTQDSGGNAPPNDCSGSYSFNFSTTYMAFKAIGPGVTINCQYWSRDSTAPFTTGLTDGLRATICP